MLSLTLRKSSTPILCHSHHYVFHPTLHGFQNKKHIKTYEILWNPHVSCWKSPASASSRLHPEDFPSRAPRLGRAVSVSTISSMGNTTFSVARALHRKPTAALYQKKKNGSCSVWLVQFLNLYAVISCIIYVIDLDSNIENGEKKTCNVLFLYCKWMEWCNATQCHVM